MCPPCWHAWAPSANDCLGCWCQKWKRRRNWSVGVQPGGAEMLNHLILLLLIIVILGIEVKITMKRK